NRVHQAVEPLGEGRVDVDGALQHRVGDVGEHQEAEDLDQLAALGAEDGGAEHPVRLSIDDQLHHPRRLVALQGAGDVGHRDGADLQRAAGGARFRLRHADAAQLRVGEDAVGNQAALDAAVLSLDNVPIDDLVVVVGDVGEGGAALHVAEGVDAGDVRLQAAVDAHVAARVRLDAGVLQPQVVRVRAAAGGDQQ